MNAREETTATADETFEGVRKHAGGRPRAKPSLALRPRGMVRDTDSGHRVYKSCCAELHEATERRLSESCVERGLRRLLVAYKDRVLTSAKNLRGTYGSRELRDEDVLAILEDAFKLERPAERTVGVSLDRVR